MQVGIEPDTAVAIPHIDLVVIVVARRFGEAAGPLREELDGDDEIAAARGGDGRGYPWGATPPGTHAQRRANFGTMACCAPDSADGYLRTAPVGTYAAGASPFGVLDMAGNVWEWTASRFPGRPGLVVLRGGG